MVDIYTDHFDVFFCPEGAKLLNSCLSLPEKQIRPLQAFSFFHFEGSLLKRFFFQRIISRKDWLFDNDIAKPCMSFIETVNCTSNFNSSCTCISAQVYFFV